MNLSLNDLAEIRRLSILAQLELARRFGVTPQTIEAIVKGRPWQRLAAQPLEPELVLPQDRKSGP